MKTKLNVKLLRKIQKHILAEPKRLDMGTFILRGDEITTHGHAIPKCGTVACIAGWAVTLSTSRKIKYTRIAARAKNLLGLDTEQAARLFHTYYWPKEFAVAEAQTCAQTPAHAHIVDSRINHFVKTRGAE